MAISPRFDQIKDKVKKIFNFDHLNKIPNFIEYLEKGLENELYNDPNTNLPPIPIEYLPVDMGLRKSSIVRRSYEWLFPVTHTFRVTYKYEGQFLDEFMPISAKDFLGRGSYKFVYRLPWNHVLKIGKSKLPSDPIFGSLFKQVSKELPSYLKQDELDLKIYLQSKLSSIDAKEKIEFHFRRLALERLHYLKIKTLLPDLILPTRHFMGIRFRKGPFSIPMSTMTPCDNQILLPGKHLKEFVQLKERLKQGFVTNIISPEWKLNFDYQKFGEVSRSKLKKIAFNFHRVIEATKYLAEKEKLILDLHSENIIIMLPDFELKIFDFHIFDEHLYELGDGELAPVDEHIETIQIFIDSFELSKKELSNITGEHESV
jgi:serine/threonine protein kinase